jgi:hypothetical protein
MQATKRAIEETAIIHHHSARANATNGPPVLVWRMTAGRLSEYRHRSAQSH